MNDPKDFNMRHFMLRASLGLALLPAIALPAWAVDAQSVSDRLVKLLDDEGLTVAIGSATEDGDDVVLGDVRFGEGDEQFTYEEIRLEDVSEDGDYFLIERAELPARTVDLDDEGTLDISSIVVDRLQLLREDDPDNIAPIQIDAFQVDRIAYAVPAGEVLVAEDISGQDMTYTANEVSEPTGSVGRFVIDTQVPFGPDNEEGAAMRQQFADLGYAKIEGRTEGTGRYDPATGVMSFTQLMDVENAASLELAGQVSALTPKLFMELQKADRKMNRIDDVEKQWEMGKEEVLPLYRQIVVDEFSVRIEDASLTNKLIGIAAERQNAQPEQLKLQVAMMTPAILAAYVPAELAQRVGEALQTYLNDPQSLAITIAPKDGTTVGQIADMAESNPQELPALLNADITANQE